MGLPPELITSYAGTVSRIQPGDEIELRREKTDSEGRGNLANLRLANKVFCRCATPLLFRHVDATVGKIERLRDVSNSPYSGYVRHVDLGIGRNASPDRAQNARHAENLASLLSPCLARFPNLSSLDFVGGTTGQEFSFEINESLVDSMTKTLSGLELPQLRELDIGFPVAHDFEHLLFATHSPPLHNFKFDLRTLTWKMLHGLRHLGLHIQEWTVASAESRYAPVPVDPAYRAFHHLLHVRRFLAIVKAAENLRSLTISCTDMSPIV
ncbi:hypothetical protein PG988_004543 [Apiospora saccharicola]